MNEPRSKGTILGRSHPRADEQEPLGSPEMVPALALAPEMAVGTRRQAGPVWPLVACVGAAVVALVLALLAVQQHNALQAERDQSRQLRDISGQTMAALTSYDYQHLDQWKKAVLANLTGSFQNTFEASVKGYEQVYLAEHNRGTGTVEGVWVGQASAGKATTVVLVQITVTSLTGTHTLEPYVQLTLLKVADRWRVDDVQYTIDSSTSPATSATAPSLPATLAPGGSPAP